MGSHRHEHPTSLEGLPSSRLLGEKELHFDSRTHHRESLCSSCQAGTLIDVTSFHPASAHSASRRKPYPRDMPDSDC